MARRLKERKVTTRNTLSLFEGSIFFQCLLSLPRSTTGRPCSTATPQRPATSRLSSAAPRAVNTSRCALRPGNLLSSSTSPLLLQAHRAATTSSMPPLLFSPRRCGWTRLGRAFSPPRVPEDRAPLQGHRATGASTCRLREFGGRRDRASFFFFFRLPIFDGRVAVGSFAFSLSPRPPALLPPPPLSLLSLSQTATACPLASSPRRNRPSLRRPHCPWPLGRPRGRLSSLCTRTGESLPSPSMNSRRRRPREAPLLPSQPASSPTPPPRAPPPAAWPWTQRESSCSSPGPGRQQQERAANPPLPPPFGRAFGALIKKKKKKGRLLLLLLLLLSSP